MADRWGGARAQAWTAAVLDAHRTPDGAVWCWLKLPGCLGHATTGDHVVPRSVAPELQYDVANGKPACQPCNRKRAASPASTASLVIDHRRFFEPS